MKAYYYDNIEGDQRLPHVDTSRSQVSEEELKAIDVHYWHIPIDSDGNWEQVGDLRRAKDVWIDQAFYRPLTRWQPSDLTRIVT